MSIPVDRQRLLNGTWKVTPLHEQVIARHPMPWHVRPQRDRLGYDVEYVVLDRDGKIIGEFVEEAIAHWFTGVAEVAMRVAMESA